MLDLQFAQASDCGRVREHNEDYLGYVLGGHGWLFALADGVGGHDLGEVASRVAVETLIAGFSRSGAGEPHTVLLPRLVQAANAKVFETGLARRLSVAPMATTLVTCALRFDRAVIAHVGDSRCYLIRRGRAEALTHDHTLAGEQVRLGLLSAREAATVETRHVLSRSVGGDLFVNVATCERRVMPGDILLLCSDGLHGAVTGPEMAAIMTKAVNLEDGARKLIDLANRRDGSDNISVQAIRIQSVERVGMYRGRPYKLA